MLALGHWELLLFAPVVLLFLSALVEPRLLDYDDSLIVVTNPAGSGLLPHPPRRPSQSGRFSIISEE